MTDFVLF